MESTLASLGSLLLKAIPTFLLILVLHFYLKYVFFKPLKRVLDQRYAATEGARKLAEESMEKAAARAAEYEAQIRAARAEVYQAEEQLYKRLEEERRQAVEAARAKSEETVEAARAELERDVEQARQSLERESELLAARIAESILGRRVA